MKKIPGFVVITLVFLSLSASAQNLKIDNISIKANGQTEVILLKKDGQIIMNGSPIGVLTSDGKLKDLNGKTAVEIDKQGKVIIDDPKMHLTINKDGEIDNGSGKKISWTKDGKLNISDNDFITISPNKKKFRQTAAFLMALYLSGKSVTTGDSIRVKAP